MYDSISRMTIDVVREAGYEEAIEGLSYNFDKSIELMKEKVAAKLALLGHGHNKFIRQIQLWIRIRAPRYWWQEFDTYKIGTTGSSQSSMHTMLTRPLTQEDFIEDIPEVWLLSLNEIILMKDLRKIKQMLPEGFLQKRMINLNYAVILEQYTQRRTHKLIEWKKYLSEVFRQVLHPEFLPEVSLG